MTVTVSQDDANSVAALLGAYDEVLRKSDDLAPAVWMRSRPPGDSPLSRWLWLPRSTIGTSTIVRIHVMRSVDSLLRLHARAAALQGADAARDRDRRALETFRASIRPVPLRVIIVAAIAAAAVIGRSLVELLGGSIDFVANSLDAEDLDAVRRLTEVLTTVATSLSASSLTEVMSGLLTEAPRVVVITLTTSLATIYLVLRPFSPAFRVKRTLFNLSGHAMTTLGESPTTWHVARSTGLYERERAVFTRLGGRAPGEIPLDLLLSASVAVIVISPFLVFDTAPEDLPVVIVPALLRMAWLFRTYRDRRRRLGLGWTLPEYATLPVTGRVVDARDPNEVIGLAFSYILLPAAWFRVTLHQDRLLREFDAHQGHLRPAPAGWRVVLRLVSACFYYVLGPLLCARRLVLVLRRPGLRTHWGVMAVAAALAGQSVAMVVTFGWLQPSEASTGEDPFWFTVGALSYYLLNALTLGAMQLLNNVLVRRLGMPLPLGIPSHPPARVSFNPPPGWPPPPEGWSPTAPWHPDPSWEALPRDWKLWVPAPRAPDHERADRPVGP